jgi:hypothetical protein
MAGNDVPAMPERYRIASEFWKISGKLFAYWIGRCVVRTTDHEGRKGEWLQAGVPSQWVEVRRGLCVAN